MENKVKKYRNGMQVLEWEVCENGCWNVTNRFINKRNKTTYITIPDGRRITSHRHVYEQMFGAIIKQVNHKCDNPTCINPEHLYDGAQSENMMDMTLRRRHTRIKLTDEDVVNIRIDDRSLSQIAKDYNVGFGTIGKIKRRERWSHIE